MAGAAESEDMVSRTSNLMQQLSAAVSDRTLEELEMWELAAASSSQSTEASLTEVCHTCCLCMLCTETALMKLAAATAPIGD